MSDNIYLSFLSRHRQILNIALTIAGFVLLGFYYFCGSSCLYLAGEVFGIDLKIWGFIFLSALLVVSILKQDILIAVILAGGLGGEIFLVAYQITHKTYCPYCLVLAFLIGLLFIINLSKKRLILSLAMIPVGFLVFFFFFQSIPLKTSDVGLPKFGQGSINVRLYSDYFCDPCQKLEPEAEKILYELVRDNKIHLVLVDVPINRNTPLYSSYYLTLAQQERSLDKIIHIRQLLFAAAKEKITDSQELAKYLEDRGIPKVTDLIDPSVEILQYMEEDDASSTPLLVVDRGKGKETYMGVKKILSTLEELK
ncbi:MAG: thioredoxin domain-containing protein [Syntrophobacterales bacterium]|jgi:thiol:disulfide interchange protein DsbA|nr:thioredoxin domain-containing protein [Syntrophobacterales bacterium]